MFLKGGKTEVNDVVIIFPHCLRGVFLTQPISSNLAKRKNKVNSKTRAQTILAFSHYVHAYVHITTKI